MRSLIRVVLPVVIIISFVAGISYIVQYTPPAPPAPPKPTAKINAPTLLVPERTYVFDPADPYYQREIEFGEKIEIDFWVANPHPVPAQVLLRAQSCSQCTKMEVGLVNADAIFRAVRESTAIGLTRAFLGQPGFDPSVLSLVTLSQAVEWRPMVVNENLLAVPRADPRLGLQFAIIRFKIDANKQGPMRLSADFSYTGGDPKPIESRFEVPITVVQPGQVSPNTVKLGEFKSGDVQKVTFVLWTSTRDSMPMEVPLLPEDPCFIFDPPRPLSREECRNVSYRLLEDSNQPPTRIRAGYLVNLTVHESLNGVQLELGPFSRKLTFNRGTPFETISTVSGTVRGDIRVEGKDGEDHISLGNFRADLPFSKSVLVTALRPDLKLKLASTHPEVLKASLKERAGPTGGWELQLEIAANALSGPLPNGSSVILELGGATPRKVRIPVSGVAFIH